jgi:hypothetical protein
MGHVIDSTEQPLLSIELRRESFKIHRGGLDYGKDGEQHIELPNADLLPLLRLLEQQVEQFEELQKIREER